MQKEGKICTKCKKWNPYENYHKARKEKDGHRQRCKKCSSEDAKRYRKYIEYKCDNCGELFQRRSDYKGKSKQCPNCNRKKVSAEKVGKPLPKLRTGKEVKCQVCGKMHYRSGSRLKKSGKNIFCSRKCMGEWQIKHFDNPNFINSADNRGENNGQYKHGKRVGGYKRHKRLKEQIIKRDGKGCFICKTDELLHVHRILAGSLGGKYEIKNCVMLCNEHHAEVHKNYKEWKERLTNYIRRESN